ncbi:hypothetical protein SEA_SOOS_21 [Gordonia phage Soos]|nr:hypothetical protein SEA_SOOS_21 [Gordonia phage Soos]
MPWVVTFPSTRAEIRKARCPLSTLAVPFGGRFGIFGTHEQAIRWATEQVRLRRPDPRDYGLAR